VKHVLALVLLSLGVLYVGVIVLLWIFQEQVVFQPPRVGPTAPESARKVHYRSADGVELFAYLVGDCPPGSALMIAFHGNADVARWFVPWASNATRATGLCVMLPEDRGYDGLAGSPSYAASALDAEAALDYARDTLGIAPGRLVLFGYSLGSAIATELAARVRPRTLVLQAPFTSVRDMSARMYVPGLRFMFDLITRVHFNTLSRVRTLSTPVWVAHGDRDRVVPIQMGKQVFDAAAHRGELLIVHGAGHTDLPEVAGSAYWSWLASAVRPTRAADGREITVGSPSAP
jgi:fermentation-respiration switch protein FrsA (DUF1100 family)